MTPLLEPFLYGLSGSQEELRTSFLTIGIFHLFHALALGLLSTLSPVG